MKISRYIIFIILFYSLFCTSCKKDSTSVSSIDVSKISRIVNSSSSSSFFYNSNGQIIKEIDSLFSFSPVHILKTTYNYSDSAIVLLITDYTNATLAQILHLNPKGLVISKDNNTFYEYNSNNYLIQEVVSYTYSLITSMKTTYSIQDGNNVIETTLVNYYGGRQEINTTKYNYSNYMNTIGTENLGQAFWGKQNKNLILSSNVVYTFDSKNRVSVVTTDSNNETKYYYAN